VTSFKEQVLQDEHVKNIANFLFIVKNLLGQIVRFNDVIRDEDVVLTILNVLPNSYENFMENVLA